MRSAAKPAQYLMRAIEREGKTGSLDYWDELKSECDEMRSDSAVGIGYYIFARGTPTDVRPGLKKLGMQPKREVAAGDIQ